MVEISIENSRISEKELTSGGVMKLVRKAHEVIRNADRSMGTGWVEIPQNTTRTDILNIKKIAKSVQEDSDCLLVLGIGGSYLGAESAIRMLKRDTKIEIIFLGTDLNSYKLLKTLDYCKNKRVSVNCISKSGTTTETAICFELVEAFMKKKYKKNNEYRRRIYITTDAENGYLREVSTKEHYQTFVIPKTVGGRYSVLTPVGLFPMAVAGINIEKVMNGAREAYNYCYELNDTLNPAYKYGAMRYLMYVKNRKLVELTTSFDDRLTGLLDWHKQLYAESEGKNGKGLFVSTAKYTTDLHSIGQFVQEGTPLLFETIFDCHQPEEDFMLENVSEDSPIRYLEGKLLSEVNKNAEKGVIKAHAEAKVPIIQIQIDNLNEESYGELVYTLETACAISGLMLGVNPFNQPGVEAYKKYMRANFVD